jgi:hypothetical protein
MVTPAANAGRLPALGRDSRSCFVRSSGLASQLWAYLRERKKWWLAPIIAVMLLVGALLIFAQGSALAPFIYTIF